MSADESTAQKISSAAHLLQSGDLLAAETLCKNVLAALPEEAGALHLLGLIACQRGELAAGSSLLERAVGLAPGNFSALASLGDALAAQSRFAEAVACYSRAETLNATAPLLFYNRANAWMAMQRRDEALADYTRALQLAPQMVEAHFNSGNALGELGRPAEALRSFDRVLALAPDLPEAQVNRGVMLARLHRHAEALAAFDRALMVRPQDADALNNRGDALGNLQRYGEALQSIDRALALAPGFAAAHYNRGTVLRDMKQYVAAAASFRRAGELAPATPFVLGDELHARMLACDWHGFTDLHKKLDAAIEAGNPAAEPFGYLGLCDGPQLARRCAASYAAQKCPPQPAAPASAPRAPGDRLRIAYLSADFYNHATAHLMAGLFEQHDKSRFEITALSYGPPRTDAMSTRLRAAFDHTIDIGSMSDAEADALIRRMGVDIAVDLKGYTAEGRTGILAARPAPVQVNYLGYPGTLGVDYIDYIIADATVIPPADRAYYAEKVVYLPHSYQANDARRPIAGAIPDRAACGLPANAFVFCCFNNSFKITPAVFDLWMRILARVDGSVLWLLHDNADAVRNLQREAQARGIDPARLVFAPRIEPDAHLARQRAADLFLDTLPYNAHTTTSDAMWAGLPVLTCPGRAFQARVAASLLQAAGMPELIAPDAAAYETLAVELATRPGKLAALRAKLAANRATCPLFDTTRFTRDIESAYAMMWQRHQQGLPPEHLTVATHETEN